MNIRELEWFRDNVAMPSMQKLLENTTLPDGLCCIDNLAISFFDGRSCGIDSQITASGLVYKDGRVEEYFFDEYDLPIADFAAAHKDCVFISDGKLHIWNELETMEISSVIRNINSCAKLFPELSQMASLHYEWNSIEYVKLQLLHKALQNENTSLPHKVQSASGQPSVNTSAQSKLRYYEDAISHLCEKLNKAEAMDDIDKDSALRNPADFAPIFKSTNYFGIYYYKGENEYYLVDRTTGEHSMVLGDSFEFVGKNLLDCMKNEEILNVANKEYLHWLVHFAYEAARDYVPDQQLTGIAVLESALRAENKKEGRSYRGPSLLEKIQSAESRASNTHTSGEKKGPNIPDR